MTTGPRLIARWRTRRRVARQLADSLRMGRTLIAVPSDLAAEVQAFVYVRRVERASEKWARRTAEVPLWAWQASMNERGQRRWASDPAASDRDEHTERP